MCHRRFVVCGVADELLYIAQYDEALMTKTATLEALIQVRW